MRYEIKAPLSVKIILGILPVVIVASWFIILQVNGRKNIRNFYYAKFSSVIIKSNSYYGRSVELHLQNGIKLYFLPPLGDKIVIGDSVVKKSNTYLYDVYRMDLNHQPHLITTYDYRKIY